MRREVRATAVTTNTSQPLGTKPSLPNLWEQNHRGFSCSVLSIHPPFQCVISYANTAAFMIPAHCLNSTGGVHSVFQTGEEKDLSQGEVVLI